jgi:hypothetical protein
VANGLGGKADALYTAIFMGLGNEKCASKGAHELGLVVASM